ncbi:TolC family protein [Xanthobacter sp. AM11]|uniref:TolC family protein n=1 Tax=Xanthobacter sp. AM11 TaxID=3380643 RepID=UPI0039BF9F73
MAPAADAAPDPRWSSPWPGIGLQAWQDVQPFPGRFTMAWRVALLCALVAAVAMLYKVPEAAIGCYLVIFLARPNGAECVGPAIGVILLASVVVLALAPVIQATAENPLMRIVVIAATSFAFVYLGSASQLGEIDSIITLVIAFILTLVDDVPAGEVVTRGLLYAWQMAAMPMALMIVFYLVLGTGPHTLLRRTVSARLLRTADAQWPATAPEGLCEELAKNTAESDKQAMMARLFNGAHQKIIYDVTRAYFLHGAARNRARISAETLANSRRIEEAAQSRRKNGVGTTVEVAQSRFGLVQAQGAERDTYQGLLATMGVSPMTDMRVQEASGRRLPGTVGVPTEALITSALAVRPDVLAAFSAMKASQSAIRAAQAEFLPKVYLGAVAAGGNSNLSASGLPTIGQQSSASGVVVGATVPLYDGGLRAAQLKTAESLAAATEATFDKTRDAAAREIMVSADTLRSALAAYTAASALAKAAATTYDAALDAYRSGLGNIQVATAADSGLLTARLAQSDAHAAALVAAANLAFVLGAMTSRDVPAQFLAR